MQRLAVDRVDGFQRPEYPLARIFVADALEFLDHGARGGDQGVPFLVGAKAKQSLRRFPIRSRRRPRGGGGGFAHARDPEPGGT